MFETPQNDVYLETGEYILVPKKKTHHKYVLLCPVIIEDNYRKKTYIK